MSDLRRWGRRRVHQGCETGYKLTLRGRVPLESGRR
jgi:hypothetical protein